jgi:hypothetical protein
MQSLPLQLTSTFSIRLSLMRSPKSRCLRRTTSSPGTTRSERVRAALLILSSVLASSASAQQSTTTCAGSPATTGYFEGIAVSKHAGTLKVSLNLGCKDGQAFGEFFTPVGKFGVTTTRTTERGILVAFGSGSDTGTVDLAAARGDTLQGQFVFGDASGPVTLVRIGETRTAGYDKPSLAVTTNQWREDLRYLATELPKQHANAFHHLTRNAFDSAVAKADSELARGTNGDEAYVAIDRIANAIGDGHTYVALPEDTIARVPIDIRLFGDQYRVVAAPTEYEQAIGARVVRVNDVPIEQAVARLRPLTPAAETKMLGDIRIEDFLTMGMLLHGVGIIPDRNTITYTLKPERGKELTLTLHGASTDAATNVKRVTAFRSRPMYMQDRNSGLWCEALRQSKTLYCSFRSYDNLPANASQLLSTINQTDPNKLVIDMRFNYGGDYTLGEKYLIEPLRAIPSINRRGHLFVLISPYTFSAGMSNAAQFRSQTNAILAGQSIGERPNSYQEVREFQLPNSHLIVRVSTKYYEFAPNRENIVRPDVQIPRTWRDYKAGRDAVLDWVEAYHSINL